MKGLNCRYTFRRSHSRPCFDLLCYVHSGMACFAVLLVFVLRSTVLRDTNDCLDSSGRMVSNAVFSMAASAVFFAVFGSKWLQSALC